MTKQESKEVKTPIGRGTKYRGWIRPVFVERPGPTHCNPHATGDGTQASVIKTALKEGSEGARTKETKNFRWGDFQGSRPSQVALSLLL